jgi:hypothetical protein
MCATIYVSMVLHSYILSVFFSCIQVRVSLLHSQSLVVLCYFFLFLMLVLGTSFKRTVNHSMISSSNSHSYSLQHMALVAAEYRAFSCLYYLWANKTFYFSDPCASILCYLILPWWVSWNEVSVIYSCGLSAEMLWAMSSAGSCSHLSVSACIHHNLCS